MHRQLFFFFGLVLAMRVVFANFKERGNLNQIWPLNFGLLIPNSQDASINASREESVFILSQHMVPVDHHQQDWSFMQEATVPILLCHAPRCLWWQHPVGHLQEDEVTGQMKASAIALPAPSSSCLSYSSNWWQAVVTAGPTHTALAWSFWPERASN